MVHENFGNYRKTIGKASGDIRVDCKEHLETPQYVFECSRLVTNWKTVKIEIG